MRKIKEEEIIVLILGMKKQEELYDYVIEKYRTCYLNEFGGNLENVDTLMENTYKLIIAIAILDIKIVDYDVKLNNKKILKINIKEFKEEYKVYIDGIKEAVKQADEVKERLSKEFLKE